MTPPCPNCGTVYHDGPLAGGFRSPSITTFIIRDETREGRFHGEEHRCAKCRHRWRVAYPGEPPTEHA